MGTNAIIHCILNTTENEREEVNHLLNLLIGNGNFIFKIGELLTFVEDKVIEERLNPIGYLLTIYKFYKYDDRITSCLLKCTRIIDKQTPHWRIFNIKKDIHYDIVNDQLNEYANWFQNKLMERLQNGPLKSDGPKEVYSNILIRYLEKLRGITC